MKSDLITKPGFIKFKLHRIKRATGELSDQISGLPIALDDENFPIAAKQIAFEISATFRAAYLFESAARLQFIS